MNSNSEIIATGCVFALFIIGVIVALIMTAEHFEWIETNWLGGTVSKEICLSYGILPTSDSTYAYQAMLVRPGDSRIYGRKSFEYKNYDLDSQNTAYSEMLEWGHKIADGKYMYLKTVQEKGNE